MLALSHSQNGERVCSRETCIGHVISVSLQKAHPRHTPLMRTKGVGNNQCDNIKELHLQ